MHHHLRPPKGWEEWNSAMKGAETSRVIFWYLASLYPSTFSLEHLGPWENRPLQRWAPVADRYKWNGFHPYKWTKINGCSWGYCTLKSVELWAPTYNWWRGPPCTGASTSLCWNCIIFEVFQPLNFGVFSFKIMIPQLDLRNKDFI